MPRDRITGFFGGVGFKAPCVVASTTNLTLSGTQTVDGVSVGGSSERVLVKDQTDTTKNGIYCASNSTWIRASDVDSYNDVVSGSLVYVDRGTEHGKTMWVFNSSATSPEIAIGTDALVMSQTAIGQTVIIETTSSDTNFAAIWGNISGTLSDQADLSTALSIRLQSSDISSLAESSDVNVKADSSDLTSKAESSDVTASLAGKTDTGHGHIVTDITDLQTALDAKATGDIFGDFVSSATGNLLSAFPQFWVGTQADYDGQGTYSTLTIFHVIAPTT